MTLKRTNQLSFSTKGGLLHLKLWREPRISSATQMEPDSERTPSIRPSHLSAQPCYFHCLTLGCVCVCFAWLSTASMSQSIQRMIKRPIITVHHSLHLRKTATNKPFSYAVVGRSAKTGLLNVCLYANAPIIFLSFFYHIPFQAWPWLFGMVSTRQRRSSSSGLCSAKPATLPSSFLVIWLLNTLFYLLFFFFSFFVPSCHTLSWEHICVGAAPLWIESEVTASHRIKG